MSQSVESEYMDEFVGATILFGEADAVPLLGATALGVVGHRSGPAQPDPQQTPGGQPQGRTPPRVIGRWPPRWEGPKKTPYKGVRALAHNSQTG